MNSLTAAQIAILENIYTGESVLRSVMGYYLLDGVHIPDAQLQPLLHLYLWNTGLCDDGSYGYDLSTNGKALVSGYEQITEYWHTKYLEETTMQNDNYQRFLQSKIKQTQISGFEISEDAINPKLYKFQRDDGVFCVFHDSPFTAIAVI